MLTERKWSLAGVARLLLGVMATMCFALGIGGLAPGMVPGLSEAQRRFLGMAVTGGLFQGATLVWIWMFLREENLSWREAFGFKFDLKVLFLGVLAGVLVFPIGEGMILLTDKLVTHFHITLDAQDLVKELEGKDLHLAQRIFFGFLAIVMAPLVEEPLFRGIIYPTIKQLGHPRLALWGSSLLFSLSHGNMMTFVPLTLFAVFLVFLYEKTDNLAAPMLAHATFNAVNFIAAHVS